MKGLKYLTYFTFGLMLFFMVPTLFVMLLLGVMSSWGIGVIIKFALPALLLIISIILIVNKTKLIFLFTNYSITIFWGLLMFLTSTKVKLLTSWIIGGLVLSVLNSILLTVEHFEKTYNTPTE